MATLSLGNIKTDSVNSGAGTIQTTGAIIGNSATAASVLTSTLNATTASLGATSATSVTTPSFSLTGNFTWPNFNGVVRINGVAATTATPFSILFSSTTVYGGGSVSVTAPQTYTTAALQDGLYEVTYNFLATHSTTTAILNWRLSIDGVLTFSSVVPRLATTNSWETVYWRRFVNFAAGTHTFLPEVWVTGTGGNGQAKDFCIVVRRVEL